MKRNLTLLSLEILACGGLLSCGGSTGSGSFVSEPFTQRSIPRVFIAKLEPMNNHYVPGSDQHGAATLTIDGDDITVKMGAASVDANIVHRAAIHRGTKCPETAADDANQDGVIDAMEGVSVYGLILVNLGADISSLEASLKGGAPMADDTSTIDYSGGGSLTAMLNDLHERPEMDPATGIGKLAPEETFKADETVVVIYGIAENTALPDTAVAFQNTTRQSSLPVLCGFLVPAATPLGSAGSDL